MPCSWAPLRSYYQAKAGSCPGSSLVGSRRGRSQDQSRTGGLSPASSTFPCPTRTQGIQDSARPPASPLGSVWTQQHEPVASARCLRVFPGWLGGGGGVRAARAPPIPLPPHPYPPTPRCHQGALAAEGQTFDPRSSAQCLSPLSPLPGPCCWPGHAPDPCFLPLRLSPVKSHACRAWGPTLLWAMLIPRLQTGASGAATDF